MIVQQRTGVLSDYRDFGLGIYSNLLLSEGLSESPCHLLEFLFIQFAVSVFVKLIEDSDEGKNKEWRGG